MNQDYRIRAYTSFLPFKSHSIGLEWTKGNWESQEGKLSYTQII